MAPAPVWVTLVGPLLGAVAAAFLGGYLVTRWKTRQDQIEKRLDELSESVEAISDMAAEYWTGVAADSGMPQREAKIVASLRHIAGLRVMLSDYISGTSIQEIEACETRFFREVSGGDFGVHNRTADPGRIISCYSSATEMMLAIRRARLRDLRGLWQRG